MFIMQRYRKHLVLYCLLLTFGMSPMSVMGQDTPPINFADHVLPIIDEYCLGCHRGKPGPKWACA